MHRLKYVYSLILSLFLFSASSLAKGPVKLFFIHSRSTSALRSIDIQTGVEEALQNAGYKVSSRSETIYHELEKKIHSSGIVEGILMEEIENYDPDYIIVNANRACEKFVDFSSAHFSKWPLIFCAIPKIPTALQIKFPQSYFLLDKFPLEKNIKLILKMHPDVEQIFATGTTSKSQNKYRFQTLYELKKKYEKRVTITPLFNVPVEDIEERITTSLTHDAILEMEDLMDRSGNIVQPNNFFPKLERKRKIPVYTFWKPSRHYNVVGGKFFDDFSKGQQAGLLIKDLIQKKPREHIMTEDCSTYAFFWKEMEHFGIPESQLPEGSVIYDKPILMTSKQQKIALGILAFIIVESLIILTLLHNIKKRRKAEKSASQSRNALQLQNQELRHLNQKKTEYLSVFAHELKTPLSTICGTGYMLKELQSRQENEDFKEHIRLSNVIIDSSETMLDKIHQLLEMEQMVSNLDSFNPSHFNLSTILTEIIEINHILAGKKQISLSINRPESLWIFSDMAKIKEMADNLISNAIKYSPQNSQIQLSWKLDNKSKDFWIFEVIDQGPGFSQQDREELFEHFQEFSTHPEMLEKNAGIGLYITKRNVKMLGGSIELQSKPNEGAHFIIRCPLKSSRLQSE